MGIRGETRARLRLPTWTALVAGVAVLGAGTLIGCGSGAPRFTTPQEAGVRVFGLEVTERPGFDYAEQLGIARSAGARALPVTIRWSAAEPARGGLDLSRWERVLRMSRARGNTVLLSVSTFARNDRLFPVDLMNRSLDDPYVLSRFSAFVEAVLDIAGRELAYVSFADEFDAHLKRHPLDREDWRGLEAFVRAGIAPLRERRPEVSVGVTLTAPLDETAPVEGLVQSSDVVFADYTFSQRDHDGGPFDHVGSHIDALVRAAGSKPLVVKEADYPTGPEHAGTELGQAQFVHALFSAWDAHRDRIPVVILGGMFDKASEACPTTGSPALSAGSCPTELRTASGIPKIAWGQLLFEATSRSF